MSALGILRSFAEARCADHEPIPARLTYGTIREALRIIERCHALEEQLGTLTELYDVTQARLEAFEEREPDARTCAEWAATVALKSSDVHSAARRYLCGESSDAAARVENDGAGFVS